MFDGYFYVIQFLQTDRFPAKTTFRNKSTSLSIIGKIKLKIVECTYSDFIKSLKKILSFKAKYFSKRFIGEGFFV